ncbi:MAG: hypothetical protein Q8K18_12120 [Burkholderiales bacterium]|nr:hypothetical protein [Burkholderiales bacterium]
MSHRNKTADGRFQQSLGASLFLAYRTRLDQRRQSLGFGPDEGGKPVGRAAASMPATRTLILMLSMR